MLVRGGGDGAEVAQLAVGAGVLDEDPEDVAAAGRRAERVGGVDAGEVGHGDLDPERQRPGPGDRQGLRQDVPVDEQDGVGVGS